jgi:LPS export ABC transporter protein LptC
VRGAAFLVLLAACNPPGVRPGQAAPLADSADQVMLNMVTSMVEDGIRTGHVEADTAYFYQAAQRMDLRRLRVRFFENGKESSFLKADQGWYTTTIGTLDARGNVVVTSTDGRKLTTPHLIYDKSTLQIRSDTVFIYDSKQEHLTGKNFTSDLEFRNVVILQPQGRQRGAGVVIPGQR